MIFRSIHQSLLSLTLSVLPAFLLLTAALYLSFPPPGVFFFFFFGGCFFSSFGGFFFFFFFFEVSCFSLGLTGPPHFSPSSSREKEPFPYGR